MKKNALKLFCAASLASAVLAPRLIAADQNDFAAQLAQMIAGQDDSAYFGQIRLAAGSRQMEVDGAKIQLDAAPETSQGRLMLPLRAVAEAAGAKVSYDAGTQTAVVGSPYGDEIRCPLVGEVLQINEKNRKMDAASYVKEGRTYVSAQVLEQALELTIVQDEAGGVAIEAPYQTCRVIAQVEKGVSLDEKALEQNGLTPEALITDGDGMWVLQFSTPAQARQAVQLLKELGAEAEPDLYVQADGAGEAQADIEIQEVSGATFTGTMMIVKDPTRISLATIYPWRENGVSLDVLVQENNAVAGINGGLYNSYNNSGGSPYGVVVSHGEIQYNRPQDHVGLVLIGFTEENILQIINLAGMTAGDVERLVEEQRIRDAVTFQEESSDVNNHFVQLIINNEPREMNGLGSGLNPRTAIGQRADGTVLLFVTDGRGKSGHLGASSGDLVSVMQEFGAVNAANLDGGSSSCMYYNGEYLMTSVTFYHSNSSWKLPAGFIVR